MRTISVKSAARVLDVLELMAGRTQGLRVNEMARQLAMPKSSASSLLATLESRGYIVPGSDGYRLVEMFRTAGWAGGITSALLRTSGPVMARLVAKTGESVFLGVPTPDLSIQYIAKAVSTSELRYDVDLASPRPAYCTSIGQVILGGLDAAALDRYFETHELKRITPRTVIDQRAIRRAIRKARDEGFVTTADGHVLGASGVAAPVRAGERIVAALAAIAPSARFEAHRARIIPAVVAAAHELGQALVHGDAQAPHRTERIAR
jgi:DNA-binding IclR family transcriptional regulator